ncbi:MAG: 3-hydroxyisobutyrate dehydrogenase [Alphaproteobacteria bacterium]|jgi:3-hydroxyisobutyrate dehydrogenase|nr:3-hydroxyisobutyrate dehydrogenase [Alphaproteobacteria bacterium]
MARIAFIGLGNMGLPMAKNLVAAGHHVTGFDLVTSAVEALAAAGGNAAGSANETLPDAEVVITMLPEGRHVRDVYGSSIITGAPAGALLIDCSTIDVDSARAVEANAREAGFEMVDAPVSGGTGGAEAGTLTFMVGGDDSAFARAKPYLDAMGKNIVHTGGPGNGQAAKICNNMILGISMVAVCESFSMAEKLGLDAQKLFNVTSTSSSQCWAMTSYLPVPGPVPASPANRDYQAGFTAAMMAKDMNLAQDAAKSTGHDAQLGAHALEMYEKFCEDGNGPLDFSGIYRMIHGN